jgi:hypothetical protein
MYSNKQQNHWVENFEGIVPFAETKLGGTPALATSTVALQ